MMASAPAMPQQQGGALRGFGVLGNRVCRRIERARAFVLWLIDPHRCPDHRATTRRRHHGRFRQHHFGGQELLARS